MLEIGSKAQYRDALPTGTVLNGYTIRGVLGRGGFGTTYYATDQLDQSFAIKEYFPKQFAIRQDLQVVASSVREQGSFDDCRSRFLQEAKRLCQLGRSVADASIVKVVTFFEANGTAYIVMEYLSGETLEDVLRRTPEGLPADRLDAMLRRILMALDHVHSGGLVHRDIKPGNIFIQQDGRPVLIDFGSAREASSNQNTTYTQVFSGGYAPLEQFAGTQQGPFSDIYAIGAVCYRAIGGKIVDSLLRHQASLRRQTDPLVPAEQFGAGRYPVSLLRMIDLALIIDADQRPQSAKDLLAILDDTPGTAGETVVMVGTEFRETPPPAPVVPAGPAPTDADPYELAPLPAAQTTAAATTKRMPDWRLLWSGAATVVADRATKTWQACRGHVDLGKIRPVLRRLSERTKALARRPRAAAIAIGLLIGAAAGGAGALFLHTGHSDGGETQAWTTVVASPSEAAYRDFADRFPNGPHHDEALANAVKLHSGPPDAEGNAPVAAGTNTPAAATDSGPANREPDATTAWEQIKTSDQPDVIAAYLEKYPDSPVLAQATARLADAKRLAGIRAEIQAEAEAWDKVKDSTLPSDIQGFLKSFPHGPNSLKAKKLLTQLSSRSDGPKAAERGSEPPPATAQPRVQVQNAPLKN